MGHRVIKKIDHPGLKIGFEIDVPSDPAHPNRKVTEVDLLPPYSV